MDTRLDSIAAEETVEYPYASGSQAWNGNSALLMARPTVTSPMVMVRGIWYVPAAMMAATLSLMLDIRRCPVRSYSMQIPISSRPEPSRLMII